MQKIYINEKMSSVLASSTSITFLEIAEQCKLLLNLLYSRQSGFTFDCIGYIESKRQLTCVVVTFLNISVNVP